MLKIIKVKEIIIVVSCIWFFLIIENWVEIQLGESTGVEVVTGTLVSYIDEGAVVVVVSYANLSYLVICISQGSFCVC